MYRVLYDPYSTVTNIDANGGEGDPAIRAMDANDDGRITLDEFTKYFLGKWAKDQLREAFDRQRIDVEAEIDKATLKETLEVMGAQMDDSAMDYMFDRLDAEKKGKVAFAKFVDYASYN